MIIDNTCNPIPSVPSSANLKHVNHFLIHLGILLVISVMYNMNKKGEITEPCGNPYSKHLLVAPRWPFIFKQTFLLKRKLCKSLMIFPVNPKCLSLTIKVGR